MLCRLFRNHMYASGAGYFLYGDNGVIYVYNGNYYEKVTTKTFLQEVIKATLAKLEVDIVYQEFSHKKIADECMSGMENHDEGRFVPDRRYVVFNNGVFDVKKGKLKDFDIQYQTDLVLDIDYDKYATNSLWDAKLSEIIPNEEMRDAFQMFCGGLLINRREIKIEYICYLLGPGSNGKSVIAQAVADVFGEDYFTKFDPKKLLKSNDSMFNLAALDGKIANFTDDLGSESISGGAFKSFVSGEKFEARHPYGHKIFKVTAPPLLCCCNALPDTTDDSWGHHRRQLPIYSSNRVWTEKDKDASLSYKLSSKDARTAIFNWIYEGYKKIIDNGGNIPLGNDVLQAQKDAQADSNSARRWIRDERLVKIDPDKANAGCWKYLFEWFDIYKEFCNKNGESSVKIAKSLSKIFQEKGFAQKRGSKGIKFCIGKLGVDIDDNGNYLDDSVSDADLPF